MTFIRPQVDEATARARFERRAFATPRRLVAASMRRLLPARSVVDTSEQRLPLLELVRLPYYRIAFSVASSNNSRTVEALIGGHEPSFALLEPEGFEWQSDTGHETFCPTIPDDEAVAIARDRLIGVIMRQSRWGRQPTLGDVQQCTLVHYPFWAYYFATRGGILDVKLLDAVTGEPTGPKLKTALLSALEGARRKD